MSKNGICPLNTKVDEVKPITVTEDEVKNSIKQIAKLNTLVIFII